jgi:4-amino-4-deoxy-L-arabinose transferase-like glycosyltransferase
VHTDAVNALATPSDRRAHLYLILLLAATAVFYVATLRQGHVWGDDFAMYIHHAQNIVEGRHYADTGYLYNPAVPAYGPRTYPPVFPILLAPLYKVFGLNLMPMKMEQVLFFVATLAVVFALWRRDLGSGYALALVAILGFSPVFWSAKDSVLSDLPFFLFFYVAALLVHQTPRDRKSSWLWGALLGLTLYLATGTRTAGIALIPGIVLYDLLRFRRVTRITGVALAVWVSLSLAQNHYIGGVSGSYVEQVRMITPHTVWLNIAEYSRVLAGFCVASVRNAFSFLVLTIIGFLISAGIVFRWRRGLTPAEALLLPYLALLLLWPFPAGIRVEFPFVPWIIFLALTGLRELSTRLAPRYSLAAACGLLLLISIPYGQAYHALDFGPIRENSGLPEFNQLCNAVYERTGQTDVFIYYRARALSLYTGRPASTYNFRGTQSELSQYSRQIHASYLITSSAFHVDGGFLTRYVQADPAKFDLIYQNEQFSLYRILPEDSQTAALSR